MPKAKSQIQITVCKLALIDVNSLKIPMLLFRQNRFCDTPSSISIYLPEVESEFENVFVNNPRAQIDDVVHVRVSAERVAECVIHSTIPPESEQLQRIICCSVQLNQLIIGNLLRSHRPTRVTAGSTAWNPGTIDAFVLATPACRTDAR